MKWFGVALGAGFIVSLLAAIFTTSAAHAEPGPGLAGRLLAAHNLERDRAGLPRLAWSDRLAQDARTWAVELSRRGALAHSSTEQRRGMGENLWMGAAGYFSVESMVGGFLSERAQFHAGRFPDISRTGNWADVGHYSQIVWPETTEVGCAVVAGGGNDFLVCRYNPAGNVWGQKVG